MTTRFALVIGNSNYQDADPVSGTKDAELMAQYLEEIGFEVLPKVIDGDLAAMTTEGLAKLGEKIGHASVVVISFSGHGFQSSGENYLMPIDGSLNPASSVSLTAIRDVLALAPREAVKIVFLDACRPEKKLPSGAPRGLKTEQAPALENTLYAFAAGSGQRTPAGEPESFSPYSEAVLRYLREPGLGIGDLLDKVSADLATIGLVPSTLNQQVPRDFCLREPVFVQAEVAKADDDLFMVLGNKVVLTASRKPQEKLQLKAGDNRFALLVSNSKTYRNNHDWSITEGWNYELKLSPVDAGSDFMEVSLKEDGEEIPFKDGPHHGKVFVAARGNLFVDQATKPPKVEVRDLNTKVWQEESLIFARFQAPLYEKSLADLPIDLDKVISDAFNLGSFGFLASAIRRVLQSGDLLGASIADPQKLFVLVLGNQAFKPLVEFCMNDQINDRIRDLKVSLAAVLARKDRPFDTFDQNLVAAMRLEAQRRGITDPAPEEILVWTALDDRSKN